MAYYLKYRPQNLDELDLENVRSRLKKILFSKNPPHAYLFTGPKGLGKTSAARIVAKILNCQKKTKKPCNKCLNCLSITKGTSLDVLEIDAASNRGIDEIRNLREKINLAPASCPNKIYIIDEVHMLTSEAFNALLKTLEEPPSHAYFILATTEPQKLPDTIISRCFQVDFKKATNQEIIRSLDRIIKAESLKIDKDAKLEIARFSDNSFREAAKILEEASFANKKIDQKLITEILGQNLKLDLKKFLTLLEKKDLKASLSQIEKISQSLSDLRFFLRFILQKLHKHLLFLNGLENDKAGLNLNSSDTQFLISLFQKAYLDLKTAIIPTLPIELALIKFCQKQKAPQNKTPNHSPSSKKIPPPKIPKKTKSTPVSLQKINDSWPQILEALKTHNHSVTAVLRSARPVDINGNTLIIEAFYKFHQEKLTEPKVITLIEKVISEFLEKDIKIECCLGKKEKPPSTPPSQKEDDLVQYVEEIFS